MPHTDIGEANLVPLKILVLQHKVLNPDNANEFTFELECMELNGLRILLISPEPWEGLHMSKHHISQALVRKGNTVVFLDPPVKGLHGIQLHDQGGVKVAQYGHWFRGVNRMPKSIHMWYYEGLIKKLVKRTGGSFDIIWCFDTSRMKWFPDGRGLKLLYLADYDILRTAQGLIRTADVIFTTSEVVRDQIKGQANVSITNVGHALDQRWFNGIEAQYERTILQPKTIVYAGQLATVYHDWEGFLECAVRHTDKEFHFIGPFDLGLPEPAFHNLLELPNVTFKGLVTKDEMIPLVRAADILLFGFRSDRRAKERANPHKILEYLSTGNVIVGSWTMEYAGGPPLMCLADRGASLAEKLDEAIEDFQKWNSPQARSARIEHAKGRSIDSLLDRIEHRLVPIRP